MPDSKLKKALHFCFNSDNAMYIVLWCSVLLTFCKAFTTHIPLIGAFSKEIFSLILILAIFLCVPFLFRRLRAVDYVFVLLCITIYSLHLIFYQENELPLSDRFLSFAFAVVPFYLVGATFDIEKFRKCFFYVSVITICASAAYYLIYTRGADYSGGYTREGYSMSASYDILPHVLMVSWSALEEMKPWKLLVMVLGVFLMLSFGTRGPLVCVFVFVAIYLLFIHKSKRRNLLRVLTLIVVAVLIYFLDDIMLAIQGALIYFGMSTRITDKFFGGGMEDTSGRDDIARDLVDIMTNDDRFFGHGLLGSYKYVGTYPHNIVVEFLFSFGIVIGIILLCVLAFFLIRSYLSCRTESEKVFFFLLLMPGILKLCLSGTFLDEKFFFFLLGYGVYLLRRKRAL